MTQAPTQQTQALAPQPAANALAVRPQMTGLLPGSAGNWPTWVQYLIAIIVAGGLGALVWVFLHRGKGKRGRKKSRARATESRRSKRSKKRKG
jgi:hypothetical protein